MLFDVAFLWEWEYDKDFINILDRKSHQFGLESFVIHPFNYSEIETQTKKGEFGARFFYDRASDTNAAFETTVLNLLTMGALPLNDPEALVTSLDKAAMHQQLLSRGLSVPYTIILPPGRDWTKIKIGELLRLGEPFIIKPAIGGGGLGVELNAKTLFDIVKAKEARSKDTFLLQEKVLPIQFGERRAWFRVYYVCGRAIPCWWDDLTHIYFRVTPEEEKVYGLERLNKETLRIAQITGLNFFSTEIAIVDKETFVIIDYVNDQCDMRLKSHFPDGVPDDVVEEIAFEIVQFIHNQINVMPRSLRLAERNNL